MPWLDKVNAFLRERIFLHMKNQAVKSRAAKARKSNTATTLSFTASKSLENRLALAAKATGKSQDEFINDALSDELPKVIAGAKSNGVPTKGQPSFVDYICGLIWSREQCPEDRSEVLDVYRRRDPKLASNLFTEDIKRLVEASIEDREVEVMIPLSLSASTWSRLIATGMEEARAQVSKDSDAEGVLALIVANAIRTGVTPSTK